MRSIFYLLSIIALSIYILNNYSEPAKIIKNLIWRITHPGLEGSEYEDSEPHKLVRLEDVYVSPKLGSAKELEPFKDFDKYKDDLFEDDNLNPPTGIYTHESELEDSGEEFDLYDKEVAK